MPATVLHLAVENGDMDVLKALCACKVNWNVPDRYKRTPLLLAVMMNRKDIVSLLLENGADPNFYDSQLMSPYAFAAGKNPEMMNLLLKSTNKPDSIVPFLNAVMAGNIDLAKQLYIYSEKMAGTNIIDYAVDFGQPEITEFLTGKIPQLFDESNKFVSAARSNRIRFSGYETGYKTPMPRVLG